MGFQLRGPGSSHKSCIWLSWLELKKLSYSFNCFLGRLKRRQSFQGDEGAETFSTWWKALFLLFIQCCSQHPIGENASLHHHTQMQITDKSLGERRWSNQVYRGDVSQCLCREFENSLLKQQKVQQNLAVFAEGGGSQAHMPPHKPLKLCTIWGQTQGKELGESFPITGVNTSSVSVGGVRIAATGREALLLSPSGDMMGIALHTNFCGDLYQAVETRKSDPKTLGCFHLLSSVTDLC